MQRTARDEVQFLPDVLCNIGRVHYSQIWPEHDVDLADIDRRHPECAPHRRATAADPGVSVANCSAKPGRRDIDGHGWVGTLLGWPWQWRCYYCGARRRGDVRPDERTT